IYYFDPAGMKVPFGTPVIVETARGSEYGFTAISNRMIPVESLTAPLKRIERLATQIDTQKHEANKALEKDAEKVFLEKVEKLGLAMNLIYVEYTFDNSRLLFYFTAETRIDFRELVKELAGVFRTRIELRQIGVRDEAKMLGGMGVCGRATCCNTFLGDFAQVSIKMAKDQSLSLNAAKISGACGKLMCCLRYEDKVYEEENARTPKVGSIVETAEGKGVVTERNALKGIVNVQLELSPEAPAKPFPREEVMVVGFNKSKDEDELDSEELKKLQDS
ncbi:MAG: stage 0 sporulation family protein, partial [Clostridia bacterium]|nr:stage 0 sporulation family protein [Clostridia bacterium]